MTALTALVVGAGAASAAVPPTEPGSPPGANDWACKPSKAHPEPVVLAHGASANMTLNWFALSPKLKAQGHCVFALTYGVPAGTPFPINQIGGRLPMEQSAKEFGAFVDRVLQHTGARKVNIVGHSEGSLMPNYYVKFLGGKDKVNRYVALTPLWDGSQLLALPKLLEFARKLGLGPVIDGIMGPVFPSALQFLHGSEFLRKLNQDGVAVPGVTYTNVMTRYDEAVVPYTSGYMHASNATNYVLQDLCKFNISEHVLVAVDPLVHQLVANSLDPANAKPIRC
ncbi:alpha/beta fold hydrolase [Crossiella sp. CA-258035]|uniref:esterase/lipase family protein n=1 Tax=Crossiella sp. CA-258035 TaxID=2981138 RepID=UPI0024BD2A1F|nr:alpha/beta fold hydrolase [Crossiella sp. CA-258035]WHT20723.1 alpha/beta fold hydrolase [Crossiella sp. CA-258035]